MSWAFFASWAVLVGAAPPSVWLSPHAQLRADEHLLRSANLPATGAGLLQFFRALTLTDQEEASVRRLVENLGSEDFRVREQASLALGRSKPGAAVMLREVLADGDLERRRRAGRCLKVLLERSDERQTQAAARLLLERKPAGASGALLGYVPSATDKMTLREVLGTLVNLGIPDPEATVDLEAQVRGSKLASRLAAALVLARHGRPEQKKLGRTVLSRAPDAILGLDLRPVDSEPFLGAAETARRAAARVLEALTQGNPSGLRGLCATPFSLGGVFLLKDQKDFDSLFEQLGAEHNQKKQPCTLEVLHAVTLEDHVPCAADNERQFLSGFKDQETRIVYVRGRLAGDREEVGGVFVRFVRGVPLVVGIGNSAPARFPFEAIDPKAEQEYQKR